LPEDPKEKEKIQDEKIEDQIDTGDKEEITEKPLEKTDSDDPETKQQEIVDEPVREKIT